MRTHWFIFPFLIGLAAMITTPSCGGGSSRGSRSVMLVGGKLILHPGTGISGQYGVVLQDNVNDVQAAATALATKYGGSVGFLYESALKGFSVSLDDAQAPNMASEPDVKFVEQDQVVTGSYK